MDFSEIWDAFQRSQRAEAKLAEIRKLSTLELKTLWDAFDGDAEPGCPGFFWPENGPHIEEIHLLLNERGEGDYCAG